MLTDFQTTVAHLFFTTPASDGFLLAGGAALLAQQMTTRPTQDLDFFTSAAGAVSPTPETNSKMPPAPAAGPSTASTTATPSADSSSTDPKTY
ncbi:hypothetical protein GCM10007304_49470 [Rhodococcoides trifolii]|uniref:Uncharacterized protein n=1 Tax=Rhodococcoides trifolii TaxID=908250 RepID=A0A917G8T0_9NOCA|nr:hypothetical protein [Rhodococcus trifolii]GGG29765.1 hypothetical protein GCM10007304_49470 [Rhodococcus trifolii]